MTRIILLSLAMYLLTVPQWFGDSLESGVVTGVSINR